MFRRLLIANRGEIALRVLRTAREMGVEVVAVYSDADRNALHVRFADRAVRIGPPPPLESYLRGDRILEAARATGSEAVHPGYGFLAENADFARAVSEAGLAFVGPPPAAIVAMGDKLSARRAAKAADVPVVPGVDEEGATEEQLRKFARQIGFPVMLKAAAGGGGKGIRIVHDEAELREAARLARAEAESAFGDGRVYLEKYLTRPRHVEVQVMGDRHGNVVSYGERECSVQRRHQKLVEESPSPALTPAMRAQMEDAARRVAQAVGYEGAGTVEFMVSEGHFYFLEMNTRLQVEHAITEERSGVYRGRVPLGGAAGEMVAPAGEPRGHSIEVRINAEDPDTFFPSLGHIERLGSPGGLGVRFDSALFRGLEVTPYYDSMLAKLIVRAGDRGQAIERALRALAELRVAGVKTSVPIAVRVLKSDAFRSGDYDTSILDKLASPVDEAKFEAAALAAALARHRKLVGNNARPGQPSRTGPSAWVRAGRIGNGVN